MDDLFNSIELSHTRNKSLDERDLEFDFGSPFNKINRKKSWSSTNNLENENTIINILEEENTLKKRSPKSNNSDSSINSDVNITDEDSSLDYENIKKERFTEHKLYINNLVGFFYYLFLTNIPIIIMNSAYQLAVVFPVDSFIFLYLSPIFYKLCFKQIFIYHYSKKNKWLLYLVYPISFIIGMCIRILDTIPFFQKFVLNTTRFDYTSVGYVALFWVLIIYLMSIFMNELYNSKYRVLNFAFLTASGLFMFFTINFYLKISYIIHIHHYFLGLILHIVCQTKKSKISIINNAIGLGIFLEGISQWGFAPLYYSYIVN